jgi:hypothetical protein
VGHWIWAATAAEWEEIGQTLHIALREPPLQSGGNPSASLVADELQILPIERRDFDLFTFSQFKSCNTLSEPLESTSKCII